VSIASRTRSILLFAALCLGLLLTLSDADFGWVTDGQIMLDTAVALREFGDIRTNYGFDTEGFTAVAGRSGKYGLGYSLVEQIPLALVEPVETAFGAGSSNVLFPMMNLILTALTGLAVAASLRDLGAGRGTGALAAAAYAFGTFAWPYVSYDFSEPLQAFCVAWAFRLAVACVRSDADPRWRAAAAAAALGLAILTKASLLVLVPGFAIYLAAAARRRHGMPMLAGFGVTLALALAGVVVLNQLRYGSWRDFGYGVEGSRFTTPLLTGLYGLLLGPNKGLVFYAPVAILVPWGLWRGLRSARRPEALLLLGSIAALLLTVATWWSWEGGFSWGPRLLFPILPLVAIAAALILDAAPIARLARILFVSCLIAGVLVNILGVLLNYTVWFGIAGLSTKRVPLSIEGRPSWEYVESEGTRYYLPQVAVSYAPALSPIVGHAWLLRVRYLGEPFLLSALPRGPGAPLIDYPPLKLDLTPLTEGYVLARLRSAHFWLWDRLRRVQREPIFAQPIYAGSLTRLGDAAVAVGDGDKGLEYHRRAQRLMALSAKAGAGGGSP